MKAHNQNILCHSPPTPPPPKVGLKFKLEYFTHKGFNNCLQNIIIPKKCHVQIDFLNPFSVHVKKNHKHHLKIFQFS